MATKPSGGTPPMIGEQLRTELLFYCFRLEDQIPEHHLLRRIDRYVDFSFVRKKLRGAYSRLGHPSIDPEILLRLLLVGSQTRHEWPRQRCSLSIEWLRSGQGLAPTPASKGRGVPSYSSSTAQFGTPVPLW
jgi:hypothetical protein